MLFIKIKEDIKDAMRNGNTVKRDLLRTLLGDACKEVKEPSDQTITDTIKSFIKKNDQAVRDICSGAGGCVQRSTGTLPEEKQILESYLPKQLTEEELRHILFEAKDNVEFTMPALMSYLKTNHKDCYNGALASKIIKEAING